VPVEELGLLMAGAGGVSAETPAGGDGTPGHGVSAETPTDGNTDD
jgi:hypothetical protein